MADERNERRVAHHHPGEGHDTGGVPWHGRELTPNPFSHDRGEMDPALAQALGGDDESAMMRVVARSRFFVPVVAAPSETVRDPETGLLTDSAAEMATVVLTSPDGERALPAFGSLETLAAWDGAARPVPVTAQTLGAAAVQESCDVLVLDLGSPTARVLRSSMVFALAQGREWVPAHRDVVVAESLALAAAEVRRSADPLGALVDVRATGLSPVGELRVEVRALPGLDRPHLHAILARLGELLSADADLRTRIDGLTLAVASSP